jgi:polyhydroxyalkanoate synthesis regulator phasin
MVDKVQITDVRPATDGAPPPAAMPPKRSPGHRGADVRDTVAEMAAKAQEISQEAGSKMASAMKDVISAAAGLTGFAIESARDLVQYMVRRGQMTQEEADKLIREAEAADAKRNPHPVPPPSRAPKPPPPPPAQERTEVFVSPGLGARPPAVSVPVHADTLGATVVKQARPSGGTARPAEAVRAAPAKKAPAAKPKKKVTASAKPKAAAKTVKKKAAGKR